MKNNKWKRIALILIVIISFSLMIGFPYALHKSKACYPQLRIWNSYDLGSVLSYYGGVLTFIGTIIVSIIAVIQTARDQEKADEINRLQLEIARRNLQIAEKSFESSKTPAILSPKFEIKANVMSGVFSELEIDIKNVTSSIVSGLTIISCEIYNPDGSMRVSATKISNKYSSLDSGKSSQCALFFGSWLRINPSRALFHENNLQINLKFSCEDEYCNVFYYAATYHIANTNAFPKGIWDTKRVG